MISRNGERTLFERHSTPRPAPKIVLESSWQKQQQPDTSEKVDLLAPETVAKSGKRAQRDQGNPTKAPELIPHQGTVCAGRVTVEEEPELKVRPQSRMMKQQIGRSMQDSKLCLCVTISPNKRPIGNKCGETQWQQRTPQEEPRKMTRLLSQSDGNRMRSTENSQQAHGWTEECCRYLDYMTTIDISYTAPEAPVREHHHVGMQG